MAKNVGGRRIGAIRNRTQFLLPNGHYAKRDRTTGEILSVKADRKPYKNVVIEREPQSLPVTVAKPRASTTPIQRPSRRVQKRPNRTAPVTLPTIPSATFPPIR